MSGGVEELVRERFSRLLEVVGTPVAFDVQAPPGRPAVLELRPGDAAEASRWSALAAAVRVLLEAALRQAGRGGSLEVRLPGAERSSPETQAAELAREARRVAAAAAERGRAFAIGPLTVVERREMHRALGDVPKVWTQSEGEGIFRRLWVVPRREPGAGRTGS